MKKRSIALLLCAAILMSLFPVMSTLAYDSSPITVTASSTTLPENADKDNGSVTLTAAPASDSVSPTNYHWQIQIPSANLWVDITGASGAKLDVTYAMVASALSGKTASLRAAATVNGETAYSEAVKLTVGAALEPAATQTTALTPKVLSQAKATTTPTTAPTTAPTEAPAADTAALEKAVTDAEASLKAAQEALTAAQAKVEPAKAAQTAAAQAVTDAETALSAAKAALETPAEGANTEDLQAAVTAAESKLAEVTDQKAIADATAVKAESDAKLAADAVTAAETALKDAKAALEAAKTPAAAPVRRARAATLFADDATTTKTFSVVINYVFENGETVSQPYTASLAQGSAFSDTINHPTVQGYLPYVGNATETSTSIVLNITDIQADVTYTVTYKPTNVDYTVIHYQQNVENDNYKEVARETLKGLTNSNVPEVAAGAKDTASKQPHYDGFYSLLYEKPPIAAVGSTVVEVYYDRYYHLMNFDLDGGYGVEPIYARYGAKIENVGTPTKAGYTFKGWSLDGTTAVDLPATMPEKNSTYKALWEAGNSAKVTIVIWGENANNEEYSYVDTSVIYAKPGSTITYGSNQLVCALETHQHTQDECYRLTCTQEEHTHNSGCYECGQESHTHGTGCYAGVGDATTHLFAPSDAKNGQIYAWNIGLASGKSIYINGTWYRYSGNLTNGQIAPTTCGKTEHTHSADCIKCGKTEHTHIFPDCYTLTCDKTEHTHNDSCYLKADASGMDTSLWTYVRSDEVIVAADGSTVMNVYFDRTQFTLTFKANNQTVATITEKWGADIHSRFPIVGTNGTEYKGAEWKVPSGCQTFTAGTNVLSIDTMPSENITFTRNNTDDSATLYYYVESLNGTGTHQHNGKYYDLYKTVYLPDSGRLTESEEFHEIIGFTKGDYSPSNIFSYVSETMYLYYTRNAYDIEYYNPTDLIHTEENVPYQKNLSSYYFEPDSSLAPDIYEPGSVQFEGWYLNPECTGEKFDFTTHTMPASADNKNGEVALSLYAKWVPVSHTVEFYLTQDAMTAGKKIGDTHPDLTVLHGSKVETVPAIPTNGSYSFVGWFYMDGNTEKAIDFANMPINRKLKVYGKWSSNVLKNYFVYYKIQDTNTDVAAPTTGSGLAGITKTFDAKGGTDLYAAYQEGYFPVVKSHSLTIDIDDEAKNTFTFEYVQKDAVPYIVRYVDKDGNPVATQKVEAGNRKAVVTETFVPVSGMMPDAYQKRLVVTGSDSTEWIEVTVDGQTVKVHPDNVITFVYVKDETHAYYKITHFTQNTDGESWTEYASSQAVGDIGKTYSAGPMTISGFTFDETVEGTVTSGELTANGLELKLYYVRNSYPYEVRYLEQGTGKVLHDPKTTTEDGKPLTGLYGKVISESAIDIANYTAVDPTSQTLTIKIEEGTDAKLNVITFYYKENEATINYEVVGPDGCGTVTPTSETLKVLSGTAQGSTAAANDNFRFLGWYSDAECTTKVSDDLHYTPTKGENDVWTNVTYYAKFEHDVTTLTITKEGANETLDPGQSFIFIVKGENLPTNGLKVTVTGNTSVTIGGLKVGSTYTITEVSDWSWRYTAEPVTTDPLVANGNNVTVVNERPNVLWLDGNSVSHNVFE